ncbi:MAG: helix-turn-helix transcriptional regulator [bacterium]|nr:helix-turn-helix transcriptional regulator [bacterium]
MKQELSVEFGNRLKKLRKSLKLTQKEFSEKIDVAPSYISEIESSKTRPGFEFLSKLFHTYQVNPLYLFEGTEPVFLTNFPVSSPLHSPTSGESTGSDEDVNELLWFMKRSKAVKFSILEHFSRYKSQYKDLINDQIAEYKSNKAG